MAYDDVIIATGGFGRYQRRIYLLLSLSTMTWSFQAMAGVFLGAETHFRCLLPHECPENSTYQIRSNLTSLSDPWNHEKQDWCERYDVNFTDQFRYLDGNFSSSTPNVKCDSFVYDKTTYELTTTIEFNLVCDNAWLKPTADSLFMVGAMLGSPIFGGLADTYGRKTILNWSLCIQAISGLCIALSPEIISYIVFRFIIAAAGSGIFQASYVNAIEMVVPEKRTMIGIGIQLFVTLGCIITAGFAYFIRNWRILQVALTAPSFGFFVYRLIPESTRWLVTTGRFEDAKHSIQKASSKNRVELSEHTLDSMLSECSMSKSDLGEPSIFDIFNYPNLRRKSLLLIFNCFTIHLTYFGLSWSTSRLVGNDYVNFMIFSLVEIPGSILIFLTIDRWGRKIILCGSLSISGISLLLTIFVPDEISWLDVTLTMMAKLAITAALITIYIFIAEQYPTVIRNVGIGVCATGTGIGGIVAPYVTYSSVVWRPLPYLILGSSSVIAGLTLLVLPETLGRKLPETIEDGEQFEKEGVKLDETSNS